VAIFERWFFARLVRLIRFLAARDEQRVQNALRHLREGEMGQRAAHVAAEVSVLQASSQHLIKPRSRHDAELTDAGDRLGQTPIRDTDAHAALNNFGKRNLHKKTYK